MKDNPVDWIRIRSVPPATKVPTPPVVNWPLSLPVSVPNVATLPAVYLTLGTGVVRGPDRVVVPGDLQLGVEQGGRIRGGGVLASGAVPSAAQFDSGA